MSDGRGTGERELLRERLRAAGLAPAEIARAERERRLPTLAIETAMVGHGRYTLTALAREVDLPIPYLRDLMRALGRAEPGRGEKAFSEKDVEVARVVRRLLDAGLPRGELIEVARVLGRATAQLADSIRVVVGDALLQPGDSEETAALRYVVAADELAPLVPKLLDYGFRVHLVDRIYGELLTEAEREAGRLAGTLDVAVAFGDLVNYTRLGERLESEDLGRIAARLADLATRSVCRPATLVKLIGDAVMFVSPDVPALIRTLTDLRDGIDACGSDFPQIRIGVAYGPATLRNGDWFGGTVNLASRVTGAAKPGQILATEDVQEQAPGAPWKKRRKRSFKGLSNRVRMFSLEGEETREEEPEAAPGKKAKAAPKRRKAEAAAT